jgi:hypothetical protein
MMNADDITLTGCEIDRHIRSILSTFGARNLYPPEARSMGGIDVVSR